MQKPPIGHPSVQSPDVPVIKKDHIIAKLKATSSLRATMEWLKERKYLPTEGEHFEFREYTATVGNWSIEWYGAKLLTNEVFLPL